jgi:hypothetical protein
MEKIGRESKGKEKETEQIPKEESELADFLPVYPSQDDPDIQVLTSSKQEFRMLASLAVEPVPLPGKFYKQQVFVARYMSAYDRLLIYHETGTGKTRSIIAAAEQMRIEKLKGGHIKRVYVIVPSVHLAREFKNQIICATQKTYLTDKIKNAMDETERRRSITTSIRSWYTVVTYGRFARMIAKERAKAKLISRTEVEANEIVLNIFSDAAFFFDEPQLIPAVESSQKAEEREAFKREKRREETAKSAEERARIQAAQPKAQSKPAPARRGRGKPAKAAPRTAEAEPKAQPKEKSAAPKIDVPVLTHAEVRDEIVRLLRSAKRIKVGVATATPMINSVDELLGIMEYLLTKERYDELSNLAKGNWSNLNLEDLEPFFRGVVSYIRALDTGAVQEFEGSLFTIDIPDKKIAVKQKIFTSLMSKFQTENFGVAVREERGKREKGGTKGSHFFHKSRQASNIVFPNGKYGNKGFDDYFVKNPDTGRYAMTAEMNKAIKEATEEAREAAETEEEKDLVDEITGIGKFSCKISAILREVSETTYTEGDSDQAIENRQRGCIFIYSPYKKAGLWPIAVFLEMLGFEPFTETESIFESASRGACGGVGERTLRSDFEPSDGVKVPFRYYLFTPETSGNIDVVIEAVQSPGNVYGAYCKIFLTSPVGGMGISVFHVDQAHLLGSLWTKKAEYQALSRFMRSVSYVDLLREKGLSLVKVEVFRHAAVPDPKVLGRNVEGSDIYLYQLNITKDVPIAEQERNLKQVAADCIIQRGRNIRETDEPFTAACDYQATCNYPCFQDVSLSEIPVDYSTYDLLYYQEDVNRIIPILQGIFRTSSTFSHRELYEEVNTRAKDTLGVVFRRAMIDRALETMLSEKISLKDTFGFTCYLENRGDFYFLQRGFPQLSGTKRYNDYYSDLLIGLEGQMLLDFVDSEVRNSDFLAEIRGMPPDDIKNEEFSSPESIVLLEDAVEEMLKNNGTLEDPGSDYSKAIMEKYKNFIFAVPERVNEVRNALIRTVRKPGRPRTTKFRAKKIKEVTKKPKRRVEEPEILGETIYIHTLYTVRTNKVEFAAWSQYVKAEGRLRVLKPSEKVGWRNMLDFEAEIYNPQLQVEIRETLQPFTQEEISGIVDISGKFKIAYRKGRKKPKKGGKQQVKGQVCTSYSVKDLLEIIHKLNFLPEEVDEKGGKEAKKKVDNKLKNSKDPLSLLKTKLVTNERMAIRKGGETTKGWNKEKLEFYAVWLEYISTRGKKEVLCSAIEDYLESKGLVYHQQG